MTLDFTFNVHESLVSFNDTQADGEPQTGAAFRFTGAEPGQKYAIHIFSRDTDAMIFENDHHVWFFITSGTFHVDIDTFVFIKGFIALIECIPGIDEQVDKHLFDLLRFAV